jgi:hypothetical protein
MEIHDDLHYQSKGIEACHVWYCRAIQYEVGWVVEAEKGLGGV